MARPRPVALLARLNPSVAGYVSGPFRLREDLEHLTRVRRAAASEAVVLYCARILEALAADALRGVSLDPSTNVFANLDTLQQYNLMPTATRYWAHALRRTGNKVRHVLERIEAQDAELAVLFTERWLAWFFHDFRHGLQQLLTCDGQPLELGGRATMRKLLAALETVDDPAAMQTVQPRDELWHAPALPAVLVEMLLDGGQTEAASKVLQTALERFDRDLRLQQLHGLCASRAGDYAEAVAILEPLYRRYEDDDETAGITAGVYKRHWWKDRDRVEALEKAQRAYRAGWKRSKKACTYLGINAASTALWLGRPEEARDIAAEVRQLLQKRVSVLKQHYPSDPEVALNYWDQVTLAEAELLLGHVAEARRLYNRAFALHRGAQPGNVEVTRLQVEALLPHVGQGSSVDVFLNSQDGFPIRPAT
jgi:tetratricopeptide (TPR) repeat protein